MKKVFLTLTVSALCCFFSGCLKMGPDYQQPELGFQTPDVYHQENSETALGEVDADRWWEAFNNPRINELVLQVAQNNLDIKKSAATVKEIQARHTQARARRFPSLYGNAEASRSEVPMSLLGASSQIISNDFTVSLPASFEWDVWGRLARADEAALYDLFQARETQITVVHSIVAEAVSLYLEMESLERRIAVNKLKIKNFEQNLRLVEKRYAAGLSSALEIRQTRRVLTQAQSVMPTYYQALGTVQHTLAVLVGQYPETSSIRMHPEDYFKQMVPVPTGLPSELLLRRPDIRSAEAGLAAASARIGEAKANRFPSITLTGAYGNTSDELDQLFSSGSEFWSIAAGLTGPIFDAGLRKAAHKAAIARYEQQMISYAKTVLSAFSEVETALLTREQQLIRREKLLDYLDEARGVQEMALKRYENGLVDYLNVLDAVVARFRAEEDVIGSDLTLMQNRVTLYRALGGGWPTVEDAAAEKEEPAEEDMDSEG